MTEERRRSERQTEASRANGAKGKGPKSNSGKERSARNSKKHGLTSSGLEPTATEQAEIDILHARLCARFDASDPVQAILIDRVLTSTLRLWRARMLITETIEDVANPSNARVLERTKARQDFLSETSLLLQEHFASEPPSKFLLEVLAKKAGHSRSSLRPRQSGVAKLASYAQRFRGERDRALIRLEALRKA